MRVIIGKVKYNWMYKYLEKPKSEYDGNDPNYVVYHETFFCSVVQVA